MRKFLKYSILLINLFFAALLTFTRFIPTANPYEYTFLGLLGLLMPVLIVINIFFIFFWLVSKKYFYIAVPVAAIWFSWKVFHVFFATNFQAKQEMKKEENSFTMMSYNVRLLDLYHWNEDKEARKKMIAFLKEKNPTLLCLQEFYSSNDAVGINNIKAIKEACHYEYVAECNMFVLKRGKWGSVIFSHLPITNAKNYEIDVQGNNLLQKADIVFKEDTFSVYNIHLKSNKLSKTESELVNQNELPSFTDSNLSKSKSIFQKLQENSVNRGLEADIISSIVLQNSKPSILCGDLNDIPTSYVYFAVRDSLQDAFLNKGFGIGKTYRNTLPFFRIDYIFYHPHFLLNGFKTLSVPYSDHEPLLASFSLMNESEKLK